MKPFTRLALWAVAFVCQTASAAVGGREPHVGYVYPAGGQVGTEVEVLVGGQYLRGVNTVYVSGGGVRGSVLQYARPLNNMDLQELRKHLTEVMQQKRAASAGRTGVPLPPRRPPGAEAVRPNSPNQPPGAQDAPNEKRDYSEQQMAELLNHPLVRNVDKMTPRELQHWINQYFDPEKRQINMQLAEMAVIKVAVDPNAVPGDRELRLATPLGLTNPVCFQVSAFPEIMEREPNDREVSDAALPSPPVLLNGQILPGDVDRFRFQARRGQSLVIEAHARQLMPYLADAVPGWFQATIAVYDEMGKEIAFADDTRFEPDPVIFCRVPEDGEYELEVRDAIYRGRQDFVYRIELGEQPFITAMFPLGGRTGVPTVASLTGWNLLETQLSLDTRAGVEHIRYATLRQGKWPSNKVSYAVDALPECEESEPNDRVQSAQKVSLPVIINGRIAKPGDSDVFCFQGQAGEEVIAEVHARRLHSPLDSLLRLTDSSGSVLAWNDDFEDKGAGLITHHADSYIRARLPNNGSYYVQLAETQRHGGKAFGYRLRMGPPQPDFALRITPSGINVPVGRTVPICVHALRKDGLEGVIEVVLKDAPPGLVLTGGRIPSGRDSVRMTLTAPAAPIDGPVPLRMEGRARIGTHTISRPVIPADDMMQAFAYRHLAPSQELLLSVIGNNRRAPKVTLVEEAPVQIPEGGATQVRISVPRGPLLREVQLELNDPPKGLTLEQVTVVPVGLAFVVKAEGDAPKAGYADNLIVEAFTEVAGGGPGGRPAAQKRRVSLGVLPAIPFEIVPQ